MKGKVQVSQMQENTDVQTGLSYSAGTISLPEMCLYTDPMQKSQKSTAQHKQEAVRVYVHTYIAMLFICRLAYIHLLYKLLQITGRNERKETMNGIYI